MNTVNILDIMRAQRKSGKAPTLNKLRRTTEEQARIDRSECMHCGKRPPQASSFLCVDCEATISMEDIRSELRRLRQSLLGREE